MKALPTVGQSMDKTVPTLSPGASVLDAVDFLLKKRVTGAPVVDGEGTLIGMFTEKDCLRIVAHSPDPQNPRGKVADYMTTEVRTVTPQMDVYYVAGLFLNVSFRRFPVVEDGKLVGAITRFDILRVVRANRDHWAEMLGA